MNLLLPIFPSWFLSKATKMTEWLDLKEGSAIKTRTVSSIEARPVPDSLAADPWNTLL